MERETEAVICPYDNNHVIHKSRIQRHLIKCSRNFPPKFKETCPFNATHLMDLSELQKHIEECPDKKYIEPGRYDFLLKSHGSMKSCPPSLAETTINHEDETWDVESTDDFSSVADDNSCQFPSPKPSDRAQKMRPPRGLSEVMMINIPEQRKADDIESITSSVGRGKLINKLGSLKPKIGKGRGFIFQDELKVGASALTDTEDLESVASSIGRGMVHRRIMNDSRYDSDMEDMRSVVSSIASPR